MSRGAHGFANGLYVVDHAGRGIDLRDQDRFYRVLAILFEPRRDGFGPHGTSEIALEHLDLAAEHLRLLAPVDGEAPTFQDQHLVAAREHIGERGLPNAVAVRGVNVGAALGAEHFLQVREQAIRERDHRSGIDVDRRPMHRGEHGIGNDGPELWAEPQTRRVSHERS